MLSTDRRRQLAQRARNALNGVGGVTLEDLAGDVLLLIEETTPVDDAEVAFVTKTLDDDAPDRRNAMGVLQRVAAELRSARAANERDRSSWAHWFEQMRKEIELSRGVSSSRGPYEWDDLAYFGEFGAALDRIGKIVDAAAVETHIADFTDCPRTQAEVAAARWREPHALRRLLKSMVRWMHADRTSPLLALTIKSWHERLASDHNPVHRVLDTAQPHVAGTVYVVDYTNSFPIRLPEGHHDAGGCPLCNTPLEDGVLCPNELCPHEG